MSVARARVRILSLLAALPFVLVGTALVYREVMRRFEGEERGFWDSFEFVAETITTTGYGHQASWDHPAAILFVVVLQFFGVFLVYMLVPFLLLPLLEDRFEVRLPRAAPALDDHVVIFRYGPAVETLLEELVAAEVPVVVVELDEDEARSLLETVTDGGKRWRRVHLIHERSIAPALRGAHLSTARAVILNGEDEENTTAALIVRELEVDVELLALVEEPHYRRALSMAGASSVLTPRHVLGAALAARASQRVQPRIDGIRQLGEHLQVVEVRIDPASELAGSSLRSADLGRRTGAHVVGKWIDGRLDSRMDADTVLEPRAVVVAIGASAAVEALSDLATGGRGQRREGPFVVAGYGEVGQKVAQLLRDVGEELVVLDLDESLDGVDLYGDIADHEIQDRLELDRARAVILALDNDSATLVATLILRGASSDLPIVARVNRAENIERLHRAGADFVLSISQVASQILAQRLLGRDALSVGSELRILRAEPSELTARHSSVAAIRRRTGCSVVAVERGDELITGIGASFAFEAEDVVYVCGHLADAERFVEETGDTRSRALA